ncbi:MAG: isocitrate/isopropylmalate dehydrogenase family protein [Methanobacteriota archaeon]|nr:MAG: isocitrate/isopropylmalate dehydrogenase family protein [Euryarchaeota archaeon]TLZ71002.1 MAG: isocitrate/isopropylmalate dehydrogenase family protein [Euryarchaeota archaeon]
MAFKIVVLAGDGVGPEVVREGVKVLKAVGTVYGLSFDLVPFPCGGQHYLDTGEEWPDGAFESCKAADAILLGAVGLPEAVLPNGEIAGVSVVFGLRFGLDLYANVRPTKLYPNVRHKIHDAFKQVWEPGKVDFVIVRENTEGLYTPTRGFLDRGGVKELAVDSRVITRKGAERVIRFAFELSKQRNGAPSDQKRRVTCVDKSNVTAGCKLFRQVYDEVAARYPTIQKDYAYIDAFQQWLLRSPEAYDVAVTTNVFGDIATDLAAVLQGGLGMAAGANIGDDHAMFEPIHGSAPKHAGKDEVNPIAMVLAVHLLLDWLGRRKRDKALRDAAAVVERAVETVLKTGKTLTYDLGGTAKCSEVGTAIATAVTKLAKEA